MEKNQTKKPNSNSTRAIRIVRKPNGKMRVIQPFDGGGKIPPSKFRVTFGGDNNNRKRKWNIQRNIDKVKKINSTENIPLKIYLDTNNVEHANTYYSTLLDLLEKLDFEVEKEDPAILGSWIKNALLKFKRAATSKEVVSRLEQVERALQLKHVDKVQSEVDLNIAEAIARLIESTNNINNFSSLVGSLLFAKATINGESVVFAQVLTQEQLKVVAERPSLLHRPIELITKMEEIKAVSLEEGAKRLKAGGE
ncbi:hypothetical protein KJK34_08930 [Flavobacterium sp. D11R37]|uniref:hypothetical protein n=1 Tax=Flavobacterium coralii TaxID=2838017 RepID=UPI001CA6ACFD|nr:hypothetical protein [Flavobacterium coralii]MBY8962871.1 hypothetical protein [Flavobacterium coralii]